VVALSTDHQRLSLVLRDGASVEPDALVLALPAHAAARLVAPIAPEAAELIGAIRHASVAVATFAFDPDTLPALPLSSGFLVAPEEGLSISACTLSTQKWPHLAPGGPVILRCSMGSIDHPPLTGDAALVSACLADLQRTLGIGTEPIDVHLARFEASLPQHEVGHLDRIAEIDAQLAHALPGLAPAGAWRLGLGMSACIRDGRAAARQAMMSLHRQPTGA
jgi:oxygen-dependent protoporphyrinogen oxidase